MDTRRNNVRELRDKVSKYRALAQEVTDLETKQRILDLTDELEQQARDIERGK
jgi:cell division protein FtsL